jgi:hypothetical protein
VPRAPLANKLVPDAKDAPANFSIGLLDGPTAADPLSAIQASTRPDLAWYIADFLRESPGYVAQRRAYLRRELPCRSNAASNPARRD